MSSNPTGIQNLPNEVLTYIFSFLTLVQRIRVEVVCKQWRLIGNSLTRLRLDLHNLGNTKLDDPTLCFLLSVRGPTLNELVLKSSSHLTGTALRKIGEYCPNLEILQLHLVDCDQITCLGSLASGCSNLKVVSLHNHLAKPCCSHVADSEEAYLSQYYSRREAASRFDELYNEGIQAIALNCNKLECLHVAYLRELKPSSLETINPNLRTFSLYFTTLTPEGMECLVRRCPELEEISLVCSGLWDEQSVLDFISHYKNTLRILKLKGLGFEHMDWRKGFQDLKNLEILHLYRCTVVDDDLMKFLSNNCLKLRDLDIGYTQVTDVGLQALDKLPWLKELRIDRQQKIKGDGLEALVAKGVLQRVVIPRDNSTLQEACQKMSAKYPKVNFVSGLDVRLFETVSDSYD